MITRQQYMDNSDKLHRKYYAQFVTPRTKAFVLDNIGLKRLQASTCPHLNDVVKWQNGGQNWLWDGSPINVVLAKELGEPLRLSTYTCVGKAAARIILEEAKVK